MEVPSVKFLGFVFQRLLQLVFSRSLDVFHVYLTLPDFFCNKAEKITLKMYILVNLFIKMFYVKVKGFLQGKITYCNIDTYYNVEVTHYSVNFIK